jgi:hypothetical protein
MDESVVFFVGVEAGCMDTSLYGDDPPLPE